MASLFRSQLSKLLDALFLKINLYPQIFKIFIFYLLLFVRYEDHLEAGALVGGLIFVLNVLGMAFLRAFTLARRNQPIFWWLRLFTWKIEMVVGEERNWYAALLGKEFSCIWDRTLQAHGDFFCVIVSVADPWHFGTDPDPWIRTPLTNRSRSGSCYFRQWPSRRELKNFYFFVFCFLLFEVTFTSFFKDKKSERAFTKQ